MTWSHQPTLAQDISHLGEFCRRSPVPCPKKGRRRVGRGLDGEQTAIIRAISEHFPPDEARELFRPAVSARGSADVIGQSQAP